MKIWIITSGSETLSLFTFLAKYDHEYVIYYDFLHRPYGDKTFHQSLDFVEAGISYLKKQKVDAIILSPIYESYILSWKMKTASWHTSILPLFTTYVKDYCFAHSLVGKIGLLWDFADVELAQDFFQHMEKWYSLTSAQKSIRKFHSPFHYRIKEVPLRKYYLTALSYSHILVNKILKFDLRYFKDAMVDTLIPLNYGYFHYQATITKFLNFKKIRFHGLSALEKIFQEFTKNDKKTSAYSVTVAYTWHPDILKREKRIIRLLQRGKSIEINRKTI